MSPPSATRTIPTEASPSSEIKVDVIYAEPLRAVERHYQLESPAVVADVLRLAAADPAFAGIDIAHAPVGVFGKIADGGQSLKDHDRVEIYRPLAADPKNARRARVRQARQRPKG